jgi:hypothetical protein
VTNSVKNHHFCEIKMITLTFLVASKHFLFGVNNCISQLRVSNNEIKCIDQCPIQLVGHQSDNLIGYKNLDK